MEELPSYVERYVYWPLPWTNNDFGSSGFTRWHAFFGLPGSHNDINVLERSSVFSHITEDHAPPANYAINGYNYAIGYYLVKTISCPQGKKAKLFAAAQESAKNDVERAFGVLQVQFTIVRRLHMVGVVKRSLTLWKRA